MLESSTFQNIVSTLKKSPSLLGSGVTGVLGLLGLGVGVFILLSPPKNEPSLNNLQNPEIVQDNFVSSPSGSVVIDVSGAVKKPGLYSLSEGARVAEALDLAGGLTIDADLGFIHKELNLADKVSEGQKIYFPPHQIETDTSSQSSSSIDGSTELISINSASADQLDTLPGIGEKLASKIIEGRPYQNIEELRSRIKIGESVFNKIKDSIKN